MSSRESGKRPIMRRCWLKQGTLQPENTIDTVHALVERPQLNLGDINQYVQMWLDMIVEKRGQIPETQHRAIVNVGLGLRFLVYDELTNMRKALLLHRL